MKSFIVACPACQQKLRITQTEDNGCKCGVLINLFHGEVEDMIQSLKESWDCREKVEAKPYPIEGYESVEFNLGDLQCVSVKYGETWVAFQDV